MDFPIVASGIEAQSMFGIHVVAGSGSNALEMIPTPSGIRFVLPSGVAPHINISQRNYFMGNDVLEEALPALGAKNVLNLKQGQRITLFISDDSICIDRQNGPKFSTSPLFIQFLERIHVSPEQNTARLLNRLNYNANTFHSHRKKFNDWAQKMTGLKNVLTGEGGSGYAIREDVELKFLKWC